MAFPDFSYCVVCDIIRRELGGKFILLGFYGMAPNVAVTISDINRPALLSILVGSPPIAEASTAFDCVTLITRPDGVGIFQTPPIRLTLSQGKGIIIPLTFNIAPPILPGSYSVRLMVNNEVKMDTSFSVHIGTATELNRQPS